MTTTSKTNFWLRLRPTHIALPLMLLALVIVFSVLSNDFLTSANLISVARQSVYLLLVTFAQMIVLLNAQLDLSVGAVIGLSSVVTALTLQEFGDLGVWTIPVALLVGTVAGILCGFFNSIAIAVLGAPAFMVTLGSMSVFTAAGLLLTNGTPASGLPVSFTSFLGTGRVVGIPVPILFALVVAVLLYVFLAWTVTGRNMYAVGGNAEAARTAGINVTWSVMLAFLISGGLAGLCGVLLAARVGSGEASLGSSYLLMTIAAAVLGGAALFGGDAAVRHAVLGVLFISILNNGMNLIRVPSYMQELVLGLVLIGAVVGNAGKIFAMLRNFRLRTQRARIER
ncbi:ABC transporter permease [Nesterenkonia lutea]|uniref:Ribose transport system permease protein n=1 Tax=Nesterenkonia lutea TaxID=272919 RepID=A0ABR9JHT1_9MICC|nr:ABC transporter permease [Nesterenkonia lutea]MBE1525482.1 ribose transport system permease protein [Nesterenkonia lutea]